MTAPTYLSQLRLPDPPDDLQMIGLTVYQEAAGEPWEGKVAVAHVILTRARQAKRSILDVVFDPWDFSAWNTESPTRMALDTMDPKVWAECYFAAVGAAGGFLPDPTQGADHYLNEAATRAGRKDGGLPSWFDEAKVTARIGKHTFLRLG